MNLTRRTFLTGLAATAVAAGAAACGTSGPQATSTNASGGAAPAGGGATMWSLSGQPNEGIDKQTVDEFNTNNANSQIKLTFFQNDAYKQKIRTALGAGQGPTLIYGWGGGNLRAYVEANQVEDLTSWVDSTPAVKDRYIKAVWEAAKVDDKVYALAGNCSQPIILFYNKELFDKHGATPPATWDDLLKLVELFNSKGVAPISLGGQSRWTSMMWLEYLLDRIGGPEPFRKIANDEADAWSDPAVISMGQRVQELVKANGFVKGFSSITADSNADQALLYTGKAAMMLHGGWVYGGIKADGKDIVQRGGLGYTAFPTMPDGKGDPKAAVGNPANYWSINAKASDAEKETAKKWLTEGLLNTTSVDSYIKNGGIPVVTGLDDKVAASEDKDYLGFVAKMMSEAPNFTQSWDQALTPAKAEPLLQNIAQLFLQKITPEQFAENMNKTIGK